MIKISNKHAIIKLDQDTIDLGIYTVKNHGQQIYGVVFESKVGKIDKLVGKVKQNQDKENINQQVHLTFDNPESIDNLIRRLEDLKVLMNFNTKVGTKA